jgi:hypothetical protein
MIWGLLSLIGQCSVFFSTLSTIEIIKRDCQPPNQMKLLPGIQCSTLLKEHKNVSGLPYIVDYHISSHWKITHITLKGTAVIKNLY